MPEETKSKSDEIFETLWSDTEFREYTANNNIPLEFIINLVDKVSELASEELKERCKTWETAFKNLDHLYHEVNEEKCKFEIENKSLITRNHIVPEHYLSEAIDRCNELEAQIEEMKNFVKSMYEANKNDAYCREYLGTILNEWDVKDE